MMEYLLVGAPLLALAVWVISPLLMRAETSALSNIPDAMISELIETKYTIYRSILDLEYDHRVGKVSDADYSILRRQLEGEAVQILRALDAASSREEIGDVLEQEIAEARRRLQAGKDTS